MDNKQNTPLFSGTQEDRKNVARALGILSPPGVEIEQSRLVVYLARIDGEWRGTLAGTNGELERFTGQSIDEVQLAMVGAAMVLAAPLADDALWQQSQRDNVVGGGQ